MGGCGGEVGVRVRGWVGMWEWEGGRGCRQWKLQPRPPATHTHAHTITRSLAAVGLRTTSTLMFGHCDAPAAWARHLARLRTLAARTGGITEFVPLPFVHMEAPMYLKGVWVCEWGQRGGVICMPPAASSCALLHPPHVHAARAGHGGSRAAARTPPPPPPPPHPTHAPGRARRGPTLRECFLVHAVARLALHPDIRHIQASWVKMGPGQAAGLLAAGCDDMGGSAGVWGGRRVGGRA